MKEPSQGRRMRRPYEGVHVEVGASRGSASPLRRKINARLGRSGPEPCASTTQHVQLRRSRAGMRSALRRLAIVLRLLAGENALGDEPGVLPDCGLYFGGDIGIGLEEELGVLAALADALAVEGEPGAGLLHHAGPHAQIDELARLGDALTIHDIELDLLERRRELVLDHLHAGEVADHFVALLDRADAADIEAYRGIELERVPARRGLRRAVHHADLHA